MHIALTHPWCWPYVQRGGERLFADLARYLAGAGHTVTTVSAGPRRRHELEAGRTRIEHRGIDPTWLRRFDVDQAVTYLPAAAWSLRRSRPDVIHGMYHLDGMAARLARCAPFAVHLQGMPVQASLRHRPVHRRLFPRSVAKAGAIVVVSHAAARALRAEFGLVGRPIHNGVFVEEFRASSQVRSERPSVLFPGAPDDERKRLPVLVEAMTLLTAQGRPVELHVAAPAPPQVEASLRTRLGAGIRFLSVREPAAMVAAYHRAWVTCSPAVREAFGLVFVEALASGRPAVGVCDGGVPEVITEERWLAAPDDPADLAAALGRALDDAESPESVTRSHELADVFDWSVRGPAFEDLYADLG